MFNLNQAPGRTAIIDEKEYLFFSGYSYLGMDHVPDFVELVKEGIDKYGLLFPSSRISNTQLDLFGAFEEKLSEITGMEDTVCFSSGFLAGRAVAEHVKKSGKNYSCAPHTHPAVAEEKTNQESFDEWKQKAGNACVLLFDSVNPLTAEVNDTSFLNDVSRSILCIIDDSHGAGLLNDATGISKNLPKKENIDYILTYSLSKAWNLGGGAVSCSKQMAAVLRRSPLFTASTSISPASAYAFLKGQHLYHQQREKLKKNIDYFIKISGGKLIADPRLPIFVLPASIDIDRLTNDNIIISSFAYPDPSGITVNRIVLNALHTQEDLEYLAAKLSIL